MSHRYGLTEQHVVVVGAGLAGLAAATYLARGGARVTLLEKARRPGGRGITDIRHGFALNRGVHALYTGGPASAVLRELGVRYTAGRPKHICMLDDSGVHPFPASTMALLTTTALSARDKRDLMRIFARLEWLRPASLASRPIDDWIAAASPRPKVRNVLASLARVYMYSAALDIISADTFVSRLQQTLKHAVHYPDGGWQTLVDGLYRAAAQAGVEVRTSASVAAVPVVDGSAQSVRLYDGSDIACSHVVLAVPPADALRLMSSTQRDPTTDVPAYAACLDLALERLPRPDRPVVFDLEQPRFMTAQSEFARLAPDGGAVVHALKPLDSRQPADPARDRAELESLMDVVQPGWRDLLVERQFLPRMLACGSLPLAHTGGLAGRLDHRSPDAANVYFAGDWVGPHGYLVDASLGSARETARLIIAERSLAATRAA